MGNWKFLACAAAVIAAAPAGAWNDRGHMIVAAKAWRHLNPQTKARAGELLRHNPRYGSWTAGVPQSGKSRAAFIHAATWPDFIKFARGYTNVRLPHGRSTRNIGYADCLQHKYWHYKDLPFSPDGTPVEPPPDPNAQTQIEAFIATLADATAGDEVKSYDLAWLIHLVGDVHQPLHATQRFVATDNVNGSKGDGGGNDVKYCLTDRCSRGSTLHSFWDGAFGDGEDLASITTFAGQMAAPPAAQAAILTPSVWFTESFGLAQAEVYKPPVGVGLGPFLLTAGYRADAARTATERASLAGVRLARILNAAAIRVRGDAPQARTCPNGV